MPTTVRHITGDKQLRTPSKRGRKARPITEYPKPVFTEWVDLAMLAPRISEMVAQVRQQEEANAVAAQLAQENCPRIFVEGQSDRLILAKALQLYFPTAVGQVRFETKRAGAGHTYVIDMLLGWRSQHKHHSERPKAVGIADGDAGQEKADFNAQPDNVKSAKFFVYPVPPNLRAAKAAHFNVHASLETLYPVAVWTDAGAKNCLAKRDPGRCAIQIW